MKFKRKIFILGIFIILIAVFGTAYAVNHQNTIFINDNNETDVFGCCSIIL